MTSILKIKSDTTSPVSTLIKEMLNKCTMN